MRFSNQSTFLPHACLVLVVSLSACVRLPVCLAVILPLALLFLVQQMKDSVENSPVQLPVFVQSDTM